MEGNKSEVTGNMSGEALKPCPFCGSEAKPVVHSHWTGVCLPGATCSDTACELYGHHFVAAWWNRRKPSERTEFAEIVERLKQRGVIPQTFDASKLGEVARRDAESAEVAHA